MFHLFQWLTASVREAVLAGVNQAISIIKTGEPGDSAEGQRLLELIGQDTSEPVNRLLDHEANGKRTKARV